MSGRQFFLDRGVGEIRGVVTLEGRPERLLIQRDGDIPALQLGARNVARVRSLEKAIGVAFLDLPGGVEAIYSLRTDELPPVRGAAIEVADGAGPCACSPARHGRWVFRLRR